MNELRTLLSRFSSRPTARGAFSVLYPQRVQQTVTLWNRCLPNVNPYYAVKCNPEPTFLNLLYDEGLGFDCASQKELNVISSLGRKASRILYANPCKSVRDIETAKELGSPCTVIDSEEELQKLEDYEGGTLIRLAVSDTSSCMPFSTKFGTSLENVCKIGQKARSMNISIKGISFHIGSGGSSCVQKHCLAYTEAILAAREAIDLLQMDVGGLHKDSNRIDIGGGFLRSEDIFEEVSCAIQKAIQCVDSVDKSAPIEWMAEPGRFMASHSFDFFVQVIGKKPGSPATGGGWHYTIDDSLYGQFSSILFDHATPTWIRVKGQGQEQGPRKRVKGTLFGRTCDSLDIIAHSASMEELEVGDWLLFPHMGAYTRATASEFNGFPAPEVFVWPYSDLEIPWNISLVQDALPKKVKYVSPASSRTFWDSVV